jgi:hypothetical protein
MFAWPTQPHWALLKRNPFDPSPKKKLIADKSCNFAALLAMAGHENGLIVNNWRPHAVKFHYMVDKFVIPSGTLVAGWSPPAVRTRLSGSVDIDCFHGIISPPLI